VNVTFLWPLNVFIATDVDKRVSIEMHYFYAHLLSLQCCIVQHY
jgi:hypothetical protein